MKFSYFIIALFVIGDATYFLLGNSSVFGWQQFYHIWEKSFVVLITIKCVLNARSKSGLYIYGLLSGWCITRLAFQLYEAAGMPMDWAGAAIALGICLMTPFVIRKLYILSKT